MRTLGSRRGTSLVELMVALVLFGIIGMATLRSLDRQARFHTGILAILEARSQHAAAHEAVAVELRSVSSPAGDIGRLSDSSIVFRLPVGGGVACAGAPAVLDLAPDSVASGQSFARFRTAPQPGDTAWILDDGPSDVASDDRWLGFHVLSTSRATGHCTGSPLVDPVLDATATSWRFTVSGILPATLSGAAVRLTRIARFALYRGGTGEHWLGFTEVQPATGAWVTIQPVSGPYLPFSASAPATSGVALGGRDSSGGTTTSTLAGAHTAISLSTRTQTSRVVRMDGAPRGLRPDSLHSLIGVRNWK
ncbi:MAG TPA: prepilin-type N-terminal cleavage/methylation domain-containing protein [Gemmatimonadaceae bacterium]